MARTELGLVRGRARPLPRLVGRRRRRPLRHDDRGRDPGQGGRLDARVAVGLNILYHASDGTGELGVPVHLVLRRLLGEAGSVGDAWELLRETPYSASSCITVIDADGAGACFELSPAGVARLEPRDGLLAHTNHFLDEDLGGGRGRAAGGLAARLARAPCGGSGAAPRALSDALALLGDHTAEPQAICRHDEPAGRAWAVRSSIRSSRSRCARASPSCTWPQAGPASARFSATPSDRLVRRQALRTSGGTAGQRPASRRDRASPRGRAG